MFFNLSLLLIILGDGRCLNNLFLTFLWMMIAAISFEYPTYPVRFEPRKLEKMFPIIFFCSYYSISLNSLRLANFYEAFGLLTISFVRFFRIPSGVNVNSAALTDFTSLSFLSAGRRLDPNGVFFFLFLNPDSLLLFNDCPYIP